MFIHYGSNIQNRSWVIQRTTMCDSCYELWTFLESKPLMTIFLDFFDVEFLKIHTGITTTCFSRYAGLTKFITQSDVANQAIYLTKEHFKFVLWTISSKHPWQSYMVTFHVLLIFNIANQVLFDEFSRKRDSILCSGRLYGFSFLGMHLQHMFTRAVLFRGPVCFPQSCGENPFPSDRFAFLCAFTFENQFFNQKWWFVRSLFCALGQTSQFSIVQW